MHRVIITLAVVLVVALALLAPVNAAVVGLWRFNEASGNAADGSGNGNTATPIGPNVSRTAGQAGFGNAASFINDGTNRSYFQTPGNYTLQVGLNAGDPWSYTAWTRANGDGFGLYFAEYAIILNQQAAGESNFGVQYHAGDAGDDQYYMWHGSNTELRLETEVPVPLDVSPWAHIAAVYDGTDYIFYKDGVERIRKPAPSQSLNYFGYDGAVQIGAGTSRPAVRNWDGQLDDVAVFNQALTPVQLATVMSGNFSSFISPLPPPTSAEWQSTAFGVWNSTSSWAPAIVPNTNAIAAVFGDAPSAATTVVAEQNQLVKSIEFNHTLPYALAGAGSVTVGPASGNGAISVLNAGGPVVHEFQLPVQLAANTDVSAAAGTTLDFDNHLRLNGRTMNITGAGRVNINNDGTSGTAGTVSNSGTLGGAGKIFGNLVNNAAGKLAIDIAGTGLYGEQGLSVTGSATLAGTLQISLLGGFTPTNGNTFDVLTAASIANNGLSLGGASSGFSFSIVGGNTLRLTFGSGLAGDYDDDGDVDGADFLLWQRTLGSTTNLAADGSGNNIVDGPDLTIWRNNYGAPAVPVAASVPEPAGVLLATLMVGASVLLQRLRRRLAVVAAGVIAATSFTTVNATVLTFDFDATANNFSSPPPASEYVTTTSSYSIVPEYGDRVNSLLQAEVPTAVFGDPPYWYNFRYANNGEGFTPNVVVDYKHAVPGNTIAFRSWVSGYSGLDRIAYPSSSSGAANTFYITFKGDAGVNVTLSSLKVARFNGQGSENITVSVFQGSDPANLGPQLFTSGSFTSTAGTPITVSPNVVGNGLTLALALAGPNFNYHWGFDDIVFSQSAGVQPTSVSWALNGSGRWTQPTNWSPDYSPTVVANGNDRTAIFGNATTAPATAVLDEDITIKKIQFNHTQPYDIAGTGQLTFHANTGNAQIEVLSAGGAVTHQLEAKSRLLSNTDVIVAAGTTFEFNNRLSLGAFDIVKSGAGTLRVNNVVESTGGEVSAVAGAVSGGGFIGGDFENAGATVAPGNSPGVLTIGGDYSQSSGALQIELGGLARGAEYDVLAVGGGMNVSGGSLDVVLLNDFQPAVGDVFDVLDFSAASGEFGSINLPNTIRWDASNLLVDGTLRVAAIVPEPHALASAAAGVILTVWGSAALNQRGRRRLNF